MNENELELVRRQIQLTFDEIQYLIRMLYSTKDYHTKNLTLNQLWNKVSLLHFLTNMLDQQQISSTVTPTLPQPSQPAPPSHMNQTTPQTVPQNLPTITREQLANATGRNGNPAYVAVGGIVYDVTNNKAWSAASHFGLPAGKDLTAEFASCHAGQQWILSTLKPVGRLV
ncbi:cytochrome b5 domain-containing protein [Ammoniphilus resinae]|uniref:Heme/steroid binding protein n=1 Tax=Ammoniphilus resinae TaxID=861532 RepID=A0ABS4GLH8_9BACL|nr:cytochrome b5 domain-containing protein [Ammoniphilus resinae]MBP1931101.1 putative heme/steroid binding protein [Ammoniphilus resinae]